MTLTLVGGEWSASHSCWFTRPVKEPPLLFGVVAWWTPEPVWIILRSKNSWSYWESKSNITVVQPNHALHQLCYYGCNFAPYALTQYSLNFEVWRPWYWNIQELIVQIGSSPLAISEVIPKPSWTDDDGNYTGIPTGSWDRRWNLLFNSIICQDLRIYVQIGGLVQELLHKINLSFFIGGTR
jgi:hypothetical protein